MTDTKPTEGVIAAVDKIAYEYPGSFFALSYDEGIRKEVTEIIQRLAVSPEKERGDKWRECAEKLGVRLRVSYDEQTDYANECLRNTGPGERPYSVEFEQSWDANRQALAEFERLEGEEAK